MQGSLPSTRLGRKIQLVAIGASTGGPQVLLVILRELPGDLGVPVLVVQHIAPRFVTGLAEWLAQGTRLAVKLAEAGEAIRPGTVYLAPDGVQMGVTKEGRIRLSKELADDGFRPSASYLFESVAGAVTIAQDEATSVIFGMPAEAIRQGAAEHVLSPEQIAGVIRSLVSVE